LAGLEVSQRVGGPALGQPQPSAGGRDEHGAHASGPPLLGEQVQQRLCLAEIAGLDSDIR